MKFWLPLIILGLSFIPVSGGNEDIDIESTIIRELPEGSQELTVDVWFSDDNYKIAWIENEFLQVDNQGKISSLHHDLPRVDYVKFVNSSHVIAISLSPGALSYAILNLSTGSSFNALSIIPPAIQYAFNLHVLTFANSFLILYAYVDTFSQESGWILLDEELNVLDQMDDIRLIAPITQETTYLLLAQDSLSQLYIHRLYSNGEMFLIGNMTITYEIETATLLSENEILLSGSSSIDDGSTYIFLKVQQLQFYQILSYQEPSLYSYQLGSQPYNFSLFSSGYVALGSDRSTTDSFILSHFTVENSDKMDHYSFEFSSTFLTPGLLRPLHLFLNEDIISVWFWDFGFTMSLLRLDFQLSGDLVDLGPITPLMWIDMNQQGFLAGLVTCWSLLIILLVFTHLADPNFLNGHYQFVKDRTVKWVLRGIRL